MVIVKKNNFTDCFFQKKYILIIFIITITIFYILEHM